MVGRRAVALAVVVMAVVVTVAGNYTVAKDEVKQQYKDHAEESVDNTKENAKGWTGWGKYRIREWLGLKGDPAAIDDDDDSDRPPGKAEKIGIQATGKVGEGEEIKDTVKQKQKQEGCDDPNKMAGETINSGHDQREVDDINHRVSAGGLRREEL